MLPLNILFRFRDHILPFSCHRFFVINHFSLNIRIYLLVLCIWIKKVIQIFFSPFPTTCSQLANIYTFICNLFSWVNYLVKFKDGHIITRLLLHKIYPFSEIRIWLNVNYILLDKFTLHLSKGYFRNIFWASDAFI